MDIDVKKNLNVVSVSRPMIKERDWSADLAYERLKTVRSAMDVLSAGINKNSIEIPPSVAEQYEKLWEKLKMLEYMESETVKWGK
jgi:hypothetical protein